MWQLEWDLKFIIIRLYNEYVKKHLAFTSVSTFIASAIPGSELYQEMLDQGKITKEQARNIDAFILKASDYDRSWTHLRLCGAELIDCFGAMAAMKEEEVELYESRMGDILVHPDSRKQYRKFLRLHFYVIKRTCR